MAPNGGNGEVDASQHESAPIEVAPLPECPIVRDFSPPVRGPKIMSCYLWGDTMDDEWVDLDPIRVSPEAACMIMQERDRWCEDGGAGNLWACLSALGLEVKYQQIYGVSKKTRFMARGHQVFRIDDDTHMDAGERSTRAGSIIQAVRDKAPETMLIISDYGKGAVLTPNDAEALEQVLALNWHTVVLDPHPRNLHKALGALYDSAASNVIVKANTVEFGHCNCGGQPDFDWEGDFDAVIEGVYKWSPCRDRINWIVTCGRRGVVLAPKAGSPADRGPVYIARGFPCRVVHSIGAGDAFMAGLCVALSYRHSLTTATYFAHLVAQTSVEMPYCGRPTLNDVMAYDMWRRQKE